MTFQRENRYIVVKIKDLDQQQEEGLRGVMYGYHIPTRECLVIESDWPEYEPAWRMIQARVEGATLSPAHIEDGEEVQVVAWQHPQYPERLMTADHKAYNESRDGAPATVAKPYTVALMTVAQHQRIVAELQSEVSRLKVMADNYFAIATDRHLEIVSLKAEAALSAPPAAGVPEEWQPMETAPKDGTLLRLLVEFEDHPIEDGAGPFATVGTNYRDNTGEDAWQIVGWCWEQDRFIDGVGTPVGWLPMLAATPPASEQQRAVVMPEITGTAIVEVVNGVEGPSLYIGDEDGGYRLAGPKPWGGGKTIHKFTVKLSELVREAMDLATPPQENDR